MTNLERLQLEIKGIDITEDELSIYLQENDLTPSQSYDTQSATNKKQIYATALSVLESFLNSSLRNHLFFNISYTMQKNRFNS